MVLSDEFRAGITAINSEFEQRLQKLRTPKDAEIALREWEEFREFATKALDLEEGKLDPTKILKRRRTNAGGPVIYVLTSRSGRWSASFSADESKKLYYGINVYEKPK